MIRLANGTEKAEDTELVGEKAVARAWDWHYKSLQLRLTAARKNPSALNRWLLKLPRNYSGRLCMPAWYAMEIYRLHVIEEKVRYAPAAPGSRRKPGTPDFSRRLRFDDSYDELVYQQYAGEKKQNHIEYEIYESRRPDYWPCQCEWCDEERTKVLGELGTAVS